MEDEKKFHGSCKAASTADMVIRSCTAGLSPFCCNYNCYTNRKGRAIQCLSPVISDVDVRGFCYFVGF